MHKFKVGDYVKYVQDEQTWEGRILAVASNHECAVAIDSILHGFVRIDWMYEEHLHEL